MQWIYLNIIEDEKEEYNKIEALQMYINPEMFIRKKESEELGDFKKRIEQTRLIYERNKEERFKKRKERLERMKK